MNWHHSVRIGVYTYEWMAPHLFVLMIKSQLENGVSQAGMEAVPAVNEALLFFHDCKTIFLSIFFGHTLKNLWGG